MILDPERYSSARVYDLLDAAAHGRVGVDRRWLRAILDRGEEAVDDLLRFGLEDRSGDPVGLELDLIDIFRYLRTPRAVPFYIELLRTAPEEAAGELLEAFTQVPEASLEPLLQLYDESDEEARGEVAFLLAALRVRDRRVLDRLKERIADDPADAAFCLGVSGDPEARPILEGLLESPPETEDPADFLECVRQAIADLGQPARPQETPDDEIWNLYPETAPPQFDVLTADELLEFLRQGTAESRAGAAEAFISRELSGEAIESLFRAARTDADAAVRAAAWEALGRVVEERGDIREAMRACLDDAAAPLQERCGALVGLAPEADDPVVRRWMIEFYGVPAARAKALEAMRNSLDRRFSPYFPQHLDDPDPEVREQSILGVGDLAIRSEAGRLRALFDDEDFRAAALYAYALAAPAEISPGRARAFLKRVDREAGGLDPSESSVVREAIDLRLRLNGHDPVFAPEDEEDGPRRARPEPAPPKPGRNDPCPCGSGKKYKKCCGA